MSLEINIEKAKGLHVNKWRKARVPLLEQLDALYFRISEDKKAPEIILEAIGRHKQELRDVTKTSLSHVKTIEDLEKVWPECLDRNHHV